MKRIALLAILLSFVSIAYAERPALPEDTEIVQVRKNIARMNPELLSRIDQIHRTPVKGLYEIVSFKRIAYIDKSGQFLLDGKLLDVNNRKNLTDDRAKALFPVAHVEFNKLPFEIAIKKVKGDGSRRMAYFTDPNCGYCKKLEQELQQVTNVTLYLFVFPIFEGSSEKARDIWCSADQVKAWDGLMINQVAPAKGDCNAPSGQVVAFGKSLDVDGTPALIFEDGTINPGFMPATDLNAMLDAAKVSANSKVEKH